MEELKHLLLTTRPDVVAIQESKLTPASQTPKIPNYTAIRTDRKHNIHTHQDATNRKITRKLFSLPPTQINITTKQSKTARTTTQQDPTTSNTSKTLTRTDYSTSRTYTTLQSTTTRYLMFGNIIPIPKPNKDVNIGTSYRPISLLSVIAKTLENVILPYITQNIPNITTQHGFKTKPPQTQHYTTSTTLSQQVSTNPFHPHAPSQ